MTTEAEVLEALRPVEDPELHRSIVDLDMVKSIKVDAGTVLVTVALTVAGCPLRAEIERRVTAAVSVLDGVARVAVTLDVMTDDERAALSSRLRGEPAGAHGHGHAHDHPGEADGQRPNPFTDNRTRVIAIASGKGGVGKSSVSANLAVALAQRGHSVAAIDADVWGFSMPRMLGIDRLPVVLDEVLLPPEAYGVRLISMGFFVSEDQPIIWRGPMLHKALNQFLTDVHWDDPEYLIVDMPPGTGDVALSMAQFLPRAEVIVVTTPQPAAQKVAQRAAYMARKVNLEVIGVIENMSWFRGDDGKAYRIFGEGGGSELAEDLGVPLIGQIPLVPELREGSDGGIPIVISDPGAEASQVLLSMAERLDTDLAAKRVYRPKLKIV